MVSSQIRAMPSNFLPVPSHGLVVGTRGSPWQELPSADSRTTAPRAPHCLRAYQLPKLGSALTGDSPSMLTWQAGAPGPFPRITRAHALPTRPMALRAPHQRVTRAHYAIPAPHGPLAYNGRQARCPGSPLSDTHLLQPRSQPVNRAPAPLQIGFEPTSPPTAKRLPFCKFN